MEDVGLFQIVELVRPADELPGGEAAVGQVAEEHVVRHQARHRHHAPARQALQFDVDAAEVGDALAVEVERVQPLEERIAGPVGQNLPLAGVERHPDVVLGARIAVPGLVDGPVRIGVRRRRLARSGGHAATMAPNVGKFRSKLTVETAFGGKIVR
jgi:hypothetical protein